MNQRHLLSGGALVCIAGAIWLFFFRYSQDIPEAATSSHYGSSPSVAASNAPPSDAEGSTQPQRLAATNGADRQILIVVENVAGGALAGAWVRATVDERIIGYCDHRGQLSVDPYEFNTGGIEIGLSGYCSEVRDIDDVPTGRPVLVTLFPDNRVMVLVVDANGAPLPRAHVTLTPFANVVLRGATQRSADTDGNGLVTLNGLVSGGYYVGVKSEGMVISSLVTNQEKDEATLEVPCEQARVVMTRPRIAWVKPRFGSIVTGYFAIPFTKMDRGSCNQECLRDLENRMREMQPGSCAQAFLASPEEVQFNGFLERGGWVQEIVPVQDWGKEAAPVMIENERAADSAMTSVLVRVLDNEGREVTYAPFALRILDPGARGAFTFPIKNGIKDLLPAGQYTFVALQGGVASLFTGPTGEVLLGGATNAHTEELTIRAKTPVQRIQLRASRRGPNGLVDLAGDVVVEDDSGFRASFFAGAAPSALWLPLGRKLRARTFQLSAAGRIVLETEFSVPLKGQDSREVLTLELAKA